MHDGRTRIHLIDLGGDIGEVRLIEWHVAVGDRVSRGDLIYTVESDKVAIEVESEQDGAVDELLADVGDTIEPGQPLLVLTP